MTSPIIKNTPYLMYKFDSLTSVNRYVEAAILKCNRFLNKSYVFNCLGFIIFGFTSKMEHMCVTLDRTNGGLLSPSTAAFRRRSRG